MKFNKYLLIVLAITFITSAGQIFAFSEFKNFYTITNASIPANNGSRTFTKTNIDLLEAGYDGQAVNNVTISPSKDTLDVRLVISSLNNKTDGWKILTNGKSTIVGTGLSYGFPVSSDVFKLTIDSRWYYTKATTVSGKWGFYNNNS